MAEGRTSSPFRDPLWFRIAWPILKATFFGLATTALVLCALLIVQAAQR